MQAGGRSHSRSSSLASSTAGLLPPPSALPSARRTHSDDDEALISGEADPSQHLTAYNPTPGVPFTHLATMSAKQWI